MENNPYLETVTELRLGHLDVFDLVISEVNDLGREIDALRARRPDLAEFIPETPPQPYRYARAPGAPLGWAGLSSFLACDALREVFRRTFAYAIPSPGAVQAIRDLGDSIVEIGAGSGYWAKLLSEAGATVYAYDYGEWKFVRSWFPVRRGYAPDAGRVDASTLFLCWPPYRTPMARRSLQAFRGEYVAYIGEGREGCTGCNMFHEILETRWVEMLFTPLLQWPGLNDALRIYRRKR